VPVAVVFANVSGLGFIKFHKLIYSGTKYIRTT